VCFSNVTWQENRPSAPRGCLCSSFYGWQGPDCQDLGPQTIFSLTMSGLVVFVSAIGVFASLYAAKRLYHVKNGKGMLNATNLTQVFSILAMTSLCLYRVNGIALLLNPQKNDEVELGFSFGVKFHQFSGRERVFTALGIIFFTLGMFNLSLMWVEVAEYSKRVMAMSSNGISRLRMVVYVSEFLFIVVIAIMLFLNAGFLIVIIASPFFTLMIGLFYFGQSRLSKILGERAVLFGSGEIGSVATGSTDSQASLRKSLAKIDSNNSSRSGGKRSTKATYSLAELHYRRILSEIRVCARLMIGWVVFTVTVGVACAVMGLTGWQNYSEPGKFSGAAICQDLLFLGILGSCCSMQYYCYRNTVNAIETLLERKRQTEEVNGNSYTGSGVSPTRRWTRSERRTTFISASTALGARQELMLGDEPGAESGSGQQSFASRENLSDSVSEGKTNPVSGHIPDVQVVELEDVSLDTEDESDEAAELK